MRQVICVSRLATNFFKFKKTDLSRDKVSTKQRVHLDIRAYYISLADGYKCSYRCSSIIIILNTQPSCKKVSKHSTRYASFWTRYPESPKIQSSILLPSCSCLTPEHDTVHIKIVTTTTTVPQRHQPNPTRYPSRRFSFHSSRRPCDRPN